jgi:hypothetical protein
MKKQWISCCCLLAAVTFAQAQSPYISKVYEYRPAPGQFINELPEYEPGDTPNDMRLKAEACIAGDEKILVSLGGYGGYIIFGFDHLVPNVPGQDDFKILGNAFYANENPNPEAPREGGSCEPGIVLVSYDANGNWQPDDAWYELAGSEYHSPATIRPYRITYRRPDEHKTPTPDRNYPALNDTTYIRWTTNGHGSGYLSRNVYHSQPYYPQWLAEDELVFEGAKLADNYIDESGNGSYYVQYAYAWGYVDNHPNHDPRSNFNIDRAVDDAGRPVQLPGIHFVKVYNGVNQYCGWLGETSTEIMGAQDLHLLPWPGTATAHPDAAPTLRLLRNPVAEFLEVFAETAQPATAYTLCGIRQQGLQLEAGTNRVDCAHWPAGIYLLRAGAHTLKIKKI